MSFYKFIRDGTVVDVGFVFLRWDKKYHRMFCCDVEKAQFIQSYIQEKAYRVNWLNPAPVEAGSYEAVDIVEISEREFDELNALLSDGETIFYEQEEQDFEQINETPQQSEDLPAEHPMTISEMRLIIAEQQEQISMLTECLLEMSEIVYGGDM